jgi:tetratricopeptide (TPR) repeat protein
VYAGGCTLEAAEAVCQAVDDHVAGVGQSLEVLDGVASLVDKSLLRQEEQASGEPRLRMLETIREYGLECLTASGEAPTVQRAHAGYYLALVEEAGPELTGPEQAVWLDRLETEHDNLRAVLYWAEESREAEIGLRLAGACCQFWLVRGHLREGRECLARLLALAQTPMPIAARAKALTGAGNLAHNLGDYTMARSRFEESLRLRRGLGDKQGIATALNDLGWTAWRQGDYTAARALSEEGLALWRELGDKQGIATALTNLGWVAHHQGDYAAAHALHQESLVLRRELGNTWSIAFSLANLGWTIHKQGDYGRATVLLEEAVALFQEVGMRQLFAFASSILAEVVHAQGDGRRAVMLLEASVRLFRDIGDKYGLALALGILGTIVHEQGNPAPALCEESLTLCREIGDIWGVATALARLGTVAHAQGDARQALALYQESWALRWTLGDKHGLTECLEGLAGVAVTQRQLEHAARLLGAAETLRTAIGAPRSRGERVQYERHVSAVHAGLGDTAFAAVWAMGQATPPEQVVAYGGPCVSASSLMRASTCRC